MFSFESETGIVLRAQRKEANERRGQVSLPKAMEYTPRNV